MKNKILIMLLAVNIFGINVNGFAANEKGNGGDAVICNGKTYTLDSAMMLEEKYFDIVKEADYESSLLKITEHLGETLPSLKNRLERFVKLFDDKGDVHSGIFWTTGRLRNVEDENLYVDIPSSCEGEIEQAVVLIKEPFRRYYYSAEILERLKDNQDELSWLLIHEWLRDFLDDSESIRFVNAYLHSKQFFESGEEEVMNSLRKLGMYRSLGPSASLERKGTNLIKEQMPILNLSADNLEKKINDFSLIKKNKEKKKQITHLNAEYSRISNLYWSEEIAKNQTLDESAALLYKKFNSRLKDLQIMLNELKRKLDK